MQAIGHGLQRRAAPLPAADNVDRAERLLSARKAVFVAAHPDDIEFYCGGLVHLMLKRGADVLFAVGTRGGKGRRGAAKERIERLRSGHQLDSARILGGARVEFFDYPDGALSEHVSPLAEELRSLIGREKPSIVFSWDPDFIYNPHPDHQAAADAARMALGSSEVRSIYYGTREPDTWVGYGEDVFRIRLQSLRAHRTEVPWFYYPWARRTVANRSAGEGAKIGCKYAEVFRRDMMN